MPGNGGRCCYCLAGFSNATVQQLDMVNDAFEGRLDAVIGLMGFHVLILDRDRGRYLENAINCLNPGAPILFFRQMHEESAPEDTVETMEQWLALTGDDFSLQTLTKKRPRH